MDIERISYIFGSFTRRRQSQDANGSSKRKSMELVRNGHDRFRSSPVRAKRSFLNTRAKSVIGSSFEESRFKCPFCKQEFVEPRVLPCLHTFCLACLENLEQNHSIILNKDDEDQSKHEVERFRKISFGPTNDKPEIRAISCPTCGFTAELPKDGARYFIPNFAIQHQMLLITMNSKSTHLLCDLCVHDAVSRCMDCAISFCAQCEENHSRKKYGNPHEVLTLDDARERGISKIQKQVMCMVHPDSELSLFCSTCYKVICHDCLTESHRKHSYEHVSKVAKHHIKSLSMAAEKARSLMERSAVDASVLNTTSKKIQTDCYKTQSDIEKFADDYIKAIEEHKQNLLEQIRIIKQDKMQQIMNEKLNLQKKIRDARDVAHFIDGLLSHGSDVEILSFIKPMIDKIETCDNLEPSNGLNYSDNIQFLTDEAVKVSQNEFTIYGVLTTQSVSAEHCRIEAKDLQNLRVGKKVNVILQTKDSKEKPLERGGDDITAEIRHRDAGVSRSIPVKIVDQKDGTYGISFVPDVAGKLAFVIKVNGEHIQGSPFPITVRSLKPHHGSFHCCSFCSSGGSKEAICGCEGKMPGGYKGCGHGHDGHPGKRHWSCCGNVLEHSECGKSRSNSQYQFTL